MRPRPHDSRAGVATQDRSLRALDRVVLGPDHRGLIARLGSPRRALVITEDWCATRT